MKSIGTFTDDKGRDRAFRIDPQKLLVSRMLITANSGHGKSALLRVLLEQLGRAAPIIVLDKDGDYVTLGEKLDVVQVGPLGEIPADIRSAGMLARRLMEKRLSSVIDLSDLKLGRKSPGDRIEPGQRDYIQAFVTELLELPRNLWRPTFVAIDEVHLYAPETGHGDAISTSAIVNLSTQGRKRGLCPLYATLRLSSVAKDAAAEQMNRIFGGVTLDNDIKRAAADLGMPAKESREILRTMKSREFYAYGPAFEEHGITKFVAGKPETTHPQAGQGRTLKPPKPSGSIKAVLKEFADLPQEAEQQIKDLTAAKARIGELERDLKKQSREIATQPGSTPRAPKQDQTIIPRLRASLEEAMKIIRTLKEKKTPAPIVDEKEIRGAVDAAVRMIVNAASNRIAASKREEGAMMQQVDRYLVQARSLLGAAPQNGHAQATTQSPRPIIAETTQRAATPSPRPAKGAETVAQDGNAPLPKSGAKKIAIALAQWHPKRLDRETLRFYAGFATGSGTFTDYLSQMRKYGMLDEQDDGFAPTQATLDWLKPEEIPAQPRTPAEYLDNAMKMPFVKSGAKTIGQYLIDHHTRVIPRDELREKAGFAEGSGTFTDYLSQMRRAGIAVDVRGGVHANPAMFES